MNSNTIVMRKNSPLAVSALRRFISSTGKNHSQTFQNQKYFRLGSEKDAVPMQNY